MMGIFLGGGVVAEGMIHFRILCVGGGGGGWGWEGYA